MVYLEAWLGTVTPKNHTILAPDSFHADMLRNAVAFPERFRRRNRNVLSRFLLKFRVLRPSQLIPGYDSAAPTDPYIPGAVEMNPLMGLALDSIVFEQETATVGLDADDS
ncbi:MAG: hypothetical protein WBW33_21570 [Bryobacteraceae bacterium]